MHTRIGRSPSPTLPLVLQPVDRVPDDSSAAAQGDRCRGDCTGKSRQGTSPLVLVSLA